MLPDQFKLGRDVMAPHTEQSPAPARGHAAIGHVLNVGLIPGASPSAWQDIQLLIPRLPAGAKVTVFTIEMPPASDGARSAVPQSRANDVEMSAQRTDATAMRSDAPARAGTPTTRWTGLSELRRQSGSDAVFKSREWSDRVDLSEREIKRAIKHNAVASKLKDDGRDHAARTISIDAMENYLATVKAVEEKRLDPPSWWDSVRGTGRRNSLRNK